MGTFIQKKKWVGLFNEIILNQVNYFPKPDKTRNFVDNNPAVFLDRDKYQDASYQTNALLRDQYDFEVR